jgi:hypothetical protein
LVDAEALMSMEGSFKEYRRVLSTALPPCIPYMYDRTRDNQRHDTTHTYNTRVAHARHKQADHLRPQQCRGVVLADLTFIEDGNPNETGPSGKLINFYKRRLMYKNISALLHLQVRLPLLVFSAFDFIQH